MSKPIFVSTDWDNGRGLEEYVARIEFFDTAKATFFYEMLKMRPDSFRLEIGYSIEPDGSRKISEVSLVNKYPKHHPVLIKRRLADKIRTTWRKLKR